MWLLMVSVKGGYKAHSFHTTLQVAETWKACLEHDGKDCAVCEVDDELLVESVEAITEK